MDKLGVANKQTHLSHQLNAARLAFGVIGDDAGQSGAPAAAVVLFIIN